MELAISGMDGIGRVSGWDDLKPSLKILSFMLSSPSQTIVMFAVLARIAKISLPQILHLNILAGICHRFVAEKSQ